MVCLSVCLCVCWLHLSALQKRAEPIEVPFEGDTAGPRNKVLDGGPDLPRGSLEGAVFGVVWPSEKHFKLLLCTLQQKSMTASVLLLLSTALLLTSWVSHLIP